MMLFENPQQIFFKVEEARQNVMKKKVIIKPESGKRLREARIKQNYSQARLAKEAECCYQWISKIENGNKALSDSLAQRFAKILFKIFV